MNERQKERPGTTDAGFGLVEVVVAMFLLAVLAVAFLPVLVQGVQRSGANATLAAATQLVNKEMEIARAQSACTALTAATYSVTDSGGVTLTVVRTVGEACPLPATSYPLTVPVDVTVSRADTGAAVSAASTLVFVTGN